MHLLLTTLTSHYHISYSDDCLSQSTRTRRDELVSLDLRFELLHSQAALTNVSLNQGKPDMLLVQSFWVCLYEPDKCL